MTNILVGKEVVYTGEKAQQGAYEIGKAYTVDRFGTCGFGEGVVVNGIYVIAFGNFEAKKPEPLTTAQDILQALYDEENIVSVDPDINTVDDTYSNGDFSNLANYEIGENKFYRESEWKEYQKMQEEIERLENGGDEEPAHTLTFFEAMELVKQGKAVEVHVDGSHTDTYRKASDLVGLTTSEIERGEWYLA